MLAANQLIFLESLWFLDSFLFINIYSVTVATRIFHQNVTQYFDSEVNMKINKSCSNIIIRILTIIITKACQSSGYKI